MVCLENIFCSKHFGTENSDRWSWRLHPSDVFALCVSYLDCSSMATTVYTAYQRYVGMWPSHSHLKVQFRLAAGVYDFTITESLQGAIRYHFKLRYCNVASWVVSVILSPPFTWFLSQHGLAIAFSSICCTYLVTAFVLFDLWHSYESSLLWFPPSSLELQRITKLSHFV